MKAAVYYELGSPDVFRYEEVPDPVCPRRGVLVEVEAISVEGGDLLHRSGGPIGPTPHIVGYQCAGTIREVGAEVKDRQVGQRVVVCLMNGSHAELVAVDEGFTWVLPDGIDLKKAACVPIPVGTAHDALFEFGRLEKGETVLVHAGAGGVGLAAIQLAKRAGATVLATASKDEKLERLGKLGMDHGINYATESFVLRTKELTGGRGADLIIDPVGGKNLERSFGAAASRGRIILIGSAGRDGHRPDLMLLQAMNLTLVGLFLGMELMLNHERVHKMISNLIDEVARGEIEIVIDREFPLEQAAEAHCYIEARNAFGRVLLIP